MRNLILLCILYAIHAAKLPDGLKLCHRSDPKFDDCLKDAITDGFKKFGGGFKPLGIPKIDPIPIPEISNESPGGLSQTYRNIEITGMHISSVTSFKSNWDDLSFEAEVVTPVSEVTGDYALKGNFLSFPLDSKGKFKIDFENVKMHHKVKMERFQKDGKNYLKYVYWKVKIMPEKVHFYYEDIMPGNEQLSKTVLDTLNENAVQIYLEQAGPFEEAYGELHKMYASKVFEQVPEDEIFLP